MCEKNLCKIWDHKKILNTSGVPDPLYKFFDVAHFCVSMYGFGMGFCAKFVRLCNLRSHPLLVLEFCFFVTYLVCLDVNADFGTGELQEAESIIEFFEFIKDADDAIISSEDLLKQRFPVIKKCTDIDSCEFTLQLVHVALSLRDSNTKKG